MNDKYALPHDFDPHYAAYALKSLSDLMFEYHTEGDSIHRTAPEGAHAIVLGAAWLNKRIANELNDYLAALDEAGVHLPDSDEDFESTPANEVREPQILLSLPSLK